MFSSTMIKPMVVPQILHTSRKEQVEVMSAVTTKILITYDKTNYCSQNITYT